jgi:hypothetical protein
MLAGMRNRIRAAYETLRQLEPETNLVKKILCVVTGYEAGVTLNIQRSTESIRFTQRVETLLHRSSIKCYKIGATAEMLF